MNQTIFVKTDNQNFISDFVQQPQAGYSEVLVPLGWVTEFMEYPDKFSYVNGVLHAPGDLPSNSIEDVQKQLVTVQGHIDSQATVMSAQAKQLAAANTTISQLQQVAGTLTGQVAQMAVSATESK